MADRRPPEPTRQEMAKIALLMEDAEAWVFGERCENGLSRTYVRQLEARVSNQAAGLDYWTAKFTKAEDQFRKAEAGRVAAEEECRVLKRTILLITAAVILAAAVSFAPVLIAWSAGW